ncbi:flavin reductase family protein [Salinispora fenicalii]|uniref:flavin reductase family protein n=1 Tax=Salinispora fenicalii TaxID=1137263 RepID=UPI00047F94A5|nr:flavin reductase family protein [Salinispora fenicalii]
MTDQAQKRGAVAGGEVVDLGSPARAALRRLASGVTVLTVHHDGTAHGATVSAIVAVSRDPLVLGVALRVSSTFTALTEKAGAFCVNVLGRYQTDLATHFADPLRPTGDAQFHNLTWHPDPHTGAPLIDGCLSHLSCRVRELHPVGDHDLIFADVVEGRHHRGEPLLSYAGRLYPHVSVALPPSLQS